MAKLKLTVVLAVMALSLAGCETFREGTTTIVVNGITYQVTYIERYYGFEATPSQTEYYVTVNGREHYCGLALAQCSDVITREAGNTQEPEGAVGE